MKWLQPPWLLVSPSVLVAVGAILIFAYVPARLAIGAAMRSMLRGSYGDERLQRMARYPGESHHRVMAHAALPRWFRGIVKSVQAALPLGLILVVTGLVVSAVGSPDASTADTSGNTVAPSTAVEGWSEGSCVTIDDEELSARPVTCTSGLAQGEITAIVDNFRDCGLSSNDWIEIEDGGFACVEMWIGVELESDGRASSPRAGWEAAGCVAIHPTEDLVMPVSCSSERAGGTITAVVRDVAGCTLPADYGVETDRNEVACVDEWGYLAHDWWFVGGCASFVDGFSEPVDCRSTHAHSEVLAIVDDLSDCPEATESIAYYDEERTVCLRPTQ